MITFEMILTISYLILFLAWLWLYLTRPEVEKINITTIEVLVNYYRTFSDSERIILISKLLNEIDFNKIEDWQKTEFKTKIDKI